MTPILIGAGIGFIIGMTVMIFYLLTLSKTLNEIDPANRKMETGQVWLTLIPLFGMVWQFIVVNHIADSLKAEFEARGIQSTEACPGAQLGVAYCTLMVCGIIPIIGG